MFYVFTKAYELPIYRRLYINESYIIKAKNKLHITALKTPKDQNKIQCSYCQAVCSSHASTSSSGSKNQISSVHLMSACSKTCLLKLPFATNLFARSRQCFPLTALF